MQVRQWLALFFCPLLSRHFRPVQAFVRHLDVQLAIKCNPEAKVHLVPPFLRFIFTFLWCWSKPCPGKSKRERPAMFIRPTLWIVVLKRLFLLITVGLRFKIESLRGQRAESPGPVAFFCLAKGGLFSVDLLYYKNRKIFQRVAIRIEVLCHWFFQTSVVDIWPVTGVTHKIYCVYPQYSDGIRYSNFILLDKGQKIKDQIIWSFFWSSNWIFIFHSVPSVYMTMLLWIKEINSLLITS